ncbi:uncharacterized protein LOC130852089 isoform X1 [Hippopotamus amphibius kiboko]|uniref:uncharacterized protein LOC130852089 isoform X1 n=1 Tax=Hippopotamus amphibius kiboko TaxID=575201 RepID=UPI0025955E21|nr:uncharacterized protein LOC130852089 isoform X1 [Hippopotamus amphibius kiboko]
MSALHRAGPARSARSAGRAGASAGARGQGRGAEAGAERSPHVQGRRPAPRGAVGARRALLRGGGRDRRPDGGRGRPAEAERKQVPAPAGGAAQVAVRLLLLSVLGRRDGPLPLSAAAALCARGLGTASSRAAAATAAILLLPRRLAGPTSIGGTEPLRTPTRRRPLLPHVALGCRMRPRGTSPFSARGGTGSVGCPESFSLGGCQPPPWCYSECLNKTEANQS